MISSRIISSLQELRRTPPIVVASMGRSGSTVLFKEIVNAVTRKLYGLNFKPFRRKVLQVAWTPARTRFLSNRVYKTHCLPSEMRGIKHPDLKIIFTYGSPMDSVISVLRQIEKRGEAWGRAHLQNLRARGSIDEIFDRDILNMEEQIRGWLDYDAHPIMCLRYPDIWRFEKEIAEFCGVDVKLPPRKEREASKQELSESLAKRLKRTYGPLEDFVSQQPGCLIRCDGKGHILE